MFFASIVCAAAPFATAILFAATLYYVDFHLIAHMGRRLAVALLLSLVASGVWHLARTWAWAWCFPKHAQISFLRLARVRLAAEAFSYLTLRGIAGEPLKVVLLQHEIDPRVATAAVAQQSSQTPVFHGGVDVLSIDVQVVDHAGHPVTGLGSGAFSVTVAGKPRRVG